ncbi:MAG: HTH domain-containing protein [Nitrososphaeraceae archaeon]
MIADRTRIKNAIEREKRRKSVAELLKRGDMNEAEIANFLNCSNSTICNDIKYLKHQAQEYVFDLARENLAYFYVSTIRDIDKARAVAWEVVNKCTDKQNMDKLSALKVIVRCDVERFKLLSEGPNVMMAKTLDEKVDLLQKEITNRNG